MAVRTVEELLTNFRSLGIDETKPEFVSMLEDMTDSYTDSDGIRAMREENSSLRNELDSARQRYIDRFYGKRGDEERRVETAATDEVAVETEDTEENEEVVTEEDLAEDLKEGI